MDTSRQFEDSAAPIHDRSGRVAGLVVVFHDVSEAQAMAQRRTHLAEHDILTSLPNRGLLDDRLEQGIALAQRHSRRLGVPFIDLDHFKHINDSLGHLIGDQILRAVALRITPCVRTSDTVSRQGGDEFIVLLSEISHAAERQIIRGDLRHALDRREFVLDYQPKVNLVNGAITGVEALIRWRHPRRGVLPPQEFIQIAEDCGLIVQIGQWALRAACLQLKRDSRF